MLNFSVRKIPNIIFGAALFSSIIAGQGCVTVLIEPEEISLSATSLVPGKFLTISHSSIVAGSSVTVEFAGAGGYLVTLNADSLQNGQVSVAVPPLVDLSTGQFQAGDVAVSISGVDSQQTLMVEELLQLNGVESGAVLKLVIESAIENYQSLLTNLGALNTDLGLAVDSSEAVAAIDAAISDLQAQLTELDTTGELVVTLPDGTTTTLGSEELAMADRLLVSLLAGVSSVNLTTSKGLSTLGQKDIFDDCIRGTNNATDQIACLKDVLAEMTADVGRGTNLASMFGTAVGAAITVYGAIQFSPLIGVTGLMVAVASSTASFGNAAVNNQNSDSFFRNDRQGFDTSEESVSQFIRIGAEAGSNLPGPVGATSLAVNLGLAVKDVYNGAESEKCGGSQKSITSLQSTDDLLEFCVIEDSPSDGGPSADPGDTTTTNPGDTISTDAITVFGYTNTDGTFSFGMQPDLSLAQISLSGNPDRPTIGWAGVNDVVLLSVAGSRTLGGSFNLLYGIEGVTQPDENGNVQDVAFTFSSIEYGRLGVPNTELLTGASGVFDIANAVNLSSVALVTVTIGTLSGELATLMFQVN